MNVGKIDEQPQSLVDFFDDYIADASSRDCVNLLAELSRDNELLPELLD